MLLPSLHQTIETTWRVPLGRQTLCLFSSLSFRSSNNGWWSLAPRRVATGRSGLSADEVRQTGVLHDDVRRHLAGHVLFKPCPGGGPVRIDLVVVDQMHAGAASIVAPVDNAGRAHVGEHVDALAVVAVDWRDKGKVATRPERREEN